MNCPRDLYEVFIDVILPSIAIGPLIANPICAHSQDQHGVPSIDDLEKELIKKQTAQQSTQKPNAVAGEFSINIPAVKPNGTLTDAQVFNGSGCTGKNLSPAVKWSGSPAGTKSFAVTVYDPDAPTGSGWWHWLVYNIPAGVTGLPERAGDADGQLLPPGAVQGRTDFGTAGFGGACPPAGDKPHRYIFTVYALKVEKIDLPAGATAAMVGYILNADQLARRSVTALYGR